MALRRDEIERMQRQLEARSRLETERDLARLLRQYNELEATLDPLRNQVLELMRAGDFERAEATMGRMDRQAAEWLAEFRGKELRSIRRMIEQAARRGAQSVDIAPALSVRQRAALDEILASIGELAASGSGGSAATIRAQYGEIAQTVRRQIDRKVYKDGLSLSRRLHVRLAEKRVEFNGILSEGLKEGRSAVRIARELQRLDVTDARLPKYIRDLERTLKGTRQAKLVDDIRRAYHQADRRKGGPLGLRGPSRRIVEAARSGVAERLDAAIGEFLDRKVRQHAITIARTEANNAFLAGHVEKAKESPWVIGVRWRLSASHRRPCECEQLASQDLYGLGPGVYPPDEVPERPHPNCFCHHVDVLDLDLMRRSA